MAQTDNIVNGRRYHDADGTYLLPNDALEHDRLDAQSQSLVALMNGKPFHAPIANPKKIVDIGCGTGAMTYLLAKKYPDAHVIGVDMSAVPDGRFTLPNIEYIQTDVVQAMKGGDERFAKGSFDYVFERLLVLGMTDWPGHISRIAGLLKPGGWLECQEITTNCTRSDGSSVSENWWHYPRWRADAADIGLDIEIGPKIRGLLAQTGEIGEIGQTVYRIPPTSRADRPELDGLGDKVLPMLQGVMRRTSSTRRSEEEVDKMVEDTRTTFTTAFEDGDAYEMFVVTGQKLGN